MAGSSGGRQTVADIATQQGQLEGRITGLERDMQNMSQAVSSLTETVSNGFRDTRELMSRAAKRQEERTSDLHGRMDIAAEKAAERGRWNPGLTVAAITCAVLVGGIFVAFVHMTTAPLAKDDIETRIAVEQHIDLDGHTVVLTKSAQAACELKDHHHEIEKLHKVTDLLIQQQIDHADGVGYNRAKLETLQDAVNTISADMRQ